MATPILLLGLNKNDFRMKQMCFHNKSINQINVFSQQKTLHMEV